MTWPGRYSDWAAAGFNATLFRWLTKSEVVYGYEEAILSRLAAHQGSIEINVNTCG